MASTSTLVLYKELRVDLEPISPKSTIHIQVAAHGQSHRSSRTARRRLPIGIAAIAEDEEAFTKKHLATSGSTYFRRNKTYPRSFLWRVLDNHKNLELRSIDLTKSEHDRHEATLTLRLAFGNAIRTGGVALSDPEEHDLLNVFVLTKGNELYTFTLRPETFCRVAATEGNVGEWCKSFMPASFSISSPHRMFASGPYELFVSLHDGRLLRLTRKAGDDGSLWRETTYTDGAWGSSLRGLIRWQGHNTIRYEGQNLEQSAGISIASSPDNAFIFTVSLNHTFKAWNLQTGKVAFTRDLLDMERQPQEVSQLLINPTESQLIQTFNAERTRDGDSYYVVTFSPHDAGEFKFWAVGEPGDSQLGIQDLFPGIQLRPPDPDPSSGAIWTMAGFEVKAAEEGAGMELWLLLRQNNAYKVYTLTFNLLDLPSAWESRWVTTSGETLHDMSEPRTSDLDPLDATDAWLNFLFYPGKYTDAVLETSLSIYQQALRPKAADPTSRGKKALKERVCAAVGSTISLERASDGVVNYQRYRRDTNAQWTRFWMLARDIDKQRWEAMSLSYDTFAGNPWLVTADGCAVIRECSDTEIIAHNERPTLDMYMDLIGAGLQDRHLGQQYDKDPGDVAGFMNAAASFRKRFSQPLLQTCKVILKSEIWQDPSYSVPVRIQSFYDRCDFVGQIGDDDYNSLITSLESIGGFQALDRYLFDAVIETLPLIFPKDQSDLLSTQFGLRVLVKGAQETIEMAAQILFDLLTLVIFVEMEAYRENEPMDDFDAAKTYSDLISLLKEYEMMRWLARTTRSESIKEPEEDVGAVSLKSASSPSSNEKKVSTILENLFAGDPRPLPASIHPQSAALTYNIRQVVSWITRARGVPFDNALVYIQCNLLINENIDLAFDFLRYQPTTAWSTYIKGRLYLCRAEFSVAATLFKKAAFVLAQDIALDDLQSMSHGLLNAIDEGHFGEGLPNYYSHIVGLFEKSKAFSYVADFARLALQHIRPNDSPSLRTDLLSRLFYASIQTSRYDEAYSALSRYTDPALRRSALTNLITSLIGANQTPHLLRLPFANNPPLHHHVDDTLASLAHKTIDLANGPPYHKALYAWRLARNDFRGAAVVLHERLRRLQSNSPTSTTSTNTKFSTSLNDPKNKAILNEYIALINILASTDPSQAWILAEGQGEGQKRKVLTLEDVRAEYQAELDRRAAIESGRFAFVGAGGADEMDVL
ncbi:MAG: hypothetical protein M1830_001507 [Pleopsidium flavum]|nr:MAG: hypothetical protein M1830_001507 [Pleopsidium flavum]